MHTSNLSQWTHEHNFSADSSSAEKRTHKVIVLTVIMMVAEIIGGSVLHSMALLADGWHMGTHVAAFVITAVAYFFGRRHSRDTRFSFGTGKMSILGGYTSAIILSMVALIMAGESIQRLFVPVKIHFSEAIAIACAGLAVNVICAFLLKDDSHHHSHHGHGDHHGGSHDHSHDLNMKAAYLHVLADAFTSLTAISALVAGRFLGWTILDPLMGLLGTVVIASWAYTLLRDTSMILLDQTPAATDLPKVIRASIESDGDARLTDLHVWQVGLNKYAAIVGVVGHSPKPPAFYRELLRAHEELVHVTVEVQTCSSMQESGHHV